MANITEYSVREYPEPKNFFEQFFGKSDPLNYADKMKTELGEESYKIYLEMKQVKEMSHAVQARLPFQFFIH